MPKEIKVTEAIINRAASSGLKLPDAGTWVANWGKSTFTNKETGEIVSKRLINNVVRAQSYEQTAKVNKAIKAQGVHSTGKIAGWRRFESKSLEDTLAYLQKLPPDKRVFITGSGERTSGKGGAAATLTLHSNFRSDEFDDADTQEIRENADQWFENIDTFEIFVK